MATNTHLSLTSWNLALDAALNVLNSGFVDIYDSTGTGQPATPDVAVTTQVKLAHMPLSATAFGAAASGTKTANAITSAAALATSTATWFRAYKSDATTAVIDGSVGTSGADMNLNSVAIASGALVSVSSWTVSDVSGQ
jgi:hypothetical protein